jgi:hypothetical protein
MRVSVNGQEYQVFFPRGKSMLTLGCDATGQPTTHSTTTEVESVRCIIRPAPTSPEDQPNPICEAEALCSPADSFDPTVGRKVALTKALRTSNFTREERRQVWDWYRSTHRLPNRSQVSVLKRKIAKLQEEVDRLAALETSTNVASKLTGS